MMRIHTGDEEEAFHTKNVSSQEDNNNEMKKSLILEVLEGFV